MERGTEEDSSFGSAESETTVGEKSAETLCCVSSGWCPANESGCDKRTGLFNIESPLISEWILSARSDSSPWSDKVWCCSVEG